MMHYSCLGVDATVCVVACQHLLLNDDVQRNLDKYTRSVELLALQLTLSDSQMCYKLYADVGFIA